MALNCFTNFITLSSACNPVTPTSGLYFDRHPEVSILRLENLTSQQVASVQDLYDRIYSRALTEFEADVQAAIGEKFRHTAIVSDIVSHEYRKAMEATVVGAEWRGVYFEVYGSENYDIAVNSVSLWSDGEQDTTLKIMDATTGKQLYSASISMEDGHNIIQLDQLFTIPGSTKRLFICYDATAFVSVETTTNGLGPDCCCHVTKCNADNVVQVTGGVLEIGDPALAANIERGADSAGLIANINIVCGVGNLICRNRLLFKVPFWYRLAIEFWREVESTDRINAFTLANPREEARRKLNGDAEAGLVSLYDQYKSKLDNAAALLPDGDGYCFDCDQGIEIVEFNP